MLKEFPSAFASSLKASNNLLYPSFGILNEVNWNYTGTRIFLQKMTWTGVQLDGVSVLFNSHSTSRELMENGQELLLLMSKSA